MARMLVLLSVVLESVWSKSGLARRLPGQAADEIRHGSADLGRAVFLNEMDAFHRDFRLVRPRAAEVALRAVVEGGGLGVDIQLGHLTLCEPAGVFAHHLRHLRRLAVEGDLA